MNILNIPLAEYHADREHTSNSRLRDFRERGAAYYYARYVARTLPEQKPTAAMVFGTAFEDMVQRPDEWDQLYAIKPADFDGRTTDGKEWLKQHRDRAHVSAEDGAKLRRMTDVVWSLLASADAPKGAIVVQPTLRATLGGVLCQARPDWIMGDAVVDLKSIDALDSIDKSVANYGYHTQCMLAHACWHGDIEAVGRPSFLLFCEKQEPHRGVFVELDIAWLALARATLARDLDLLQRCQQSGQWPLVWTNTVISTPPPWVNA